jgi:hypothetical protein
MPRRAAVQSTRLCKYAHAFFDECRIRGDDVIIAGQPCMAGKSDYYPKMPFSSPIRLATTASTSQ